MKLIVGLGNPGKKYEKTRHNTGFLVMDLILKELNISLDQEGFDAIYTTTKVNGEKVILMKPYTYMNESGRAVKACADYYKVDVEDILIIHDDLDLPVGKIRIRKGGSCGGQNGMRNIIDLLHTSDIKRIRVGISKDKMIDTIDYVLGKVNKEDKPAYTQSLIKAKDAAIFFINNDFDLVMNRYNI